MDPELVEALSRGEELLERTQEVAKQVEDRARKLIRSPVGPARRPTSH